MEAGRAVDSAESEASAARAAQSAAVLEFVDQLGKELSRGTLHLPSFPDAVVRIQQVLNDRNATTRMVVQVVQAEPVFTAKLFRMANSVMLQRGDRPVTDLKEVVTRLGFDMVKNLAVALATRQIMNSKKYAALHAELRELWAHSVETAAIAFVLARNSRRVSPEDAVLAGLLHDIGTFYIYSRMSEHPELFGEREAMAAILDDWHTGVGHAILGDWDFPAALVEAVDDHESWERTHVGRADLTDVVTIANLLAHWDTPKQKSVDLDAVPALERLRLTPDGALETLRESRADVESIIVALS